MACTGVVTFTVTTPKTYTLSQRMDIATDGYWTLDASTSAGVTLVAAPNELLFYSSADLSVVDGALVLKGLTLKGNGAVDDDSGCASIYGIPFTATDCVFEHCRGTDGGAVRSGFAYV